MDRLDKILVVKGMTATRSQAESYIKLGWVNVNGLPASKAGQMVSENDQITISNRQQYVSRAALKLESVIQALDLDFKFKTVLDVGSSTGGFTDLALRQGAAKVIAVDVGTDQMHPKLRTDERVELHEKTDIRDFGMKIAPDVIVIDVSFISLREILPHIANLCNDETVIVAMVKPQFEATAAEINKGVIKNDTVRRRILADFEHWAKKLFTVYAKADSSVAGSKGNRERFFLLKKQNSGVDINRLRVLR